MAQPSLIQTHKSFLLRLLVATLLVGIFDYAYYAQNTNLLIGIAADIVIALATYLLVLRYMGTWLMRLAGTVAVMIASVVISPITINVGFLTAHYLGYSLMQSSISLTAIGYAIAYALAAVAVMALWRKSRPRRPGKSRKA